MLLERIATRLLNESKLDSVARSVTRSAVAAVKGMSTRANREPWKKNDEGRWTRSSNTAERLSIPLPRVGPLSIKLVINLSVLKTDRKTSVGVSAGTDGETRLTLHISAYSPMGMITPQHYSMIQERLYNVVRHELEHFYQTGDEWSSTADVAAAFEEKPGVMARRVAYFTDPGEVAAEVSGMYNAAKRRRVPFIQVVDEEIKKIKATMEDEDKTPEQIDRVTRKIRATWVAYAKTRFPGAQLTRS